MTSFAEQDWHSIVYIDYIPGYHLAFDGFTLQAGLRLQLPGSSSLLVLKQTWP